VIEAEAWGRLRPRHSSGWRAHVAQRRGLLGQGRRARRLPQAGREPRGWTPREAVEAAVIDHLSTQVLQVTNLRSLLDEVNEGLALGAIEPAVIADRINDLKRTTDLLTAELTNLDARLAERTSAPPEIASLSTTIAAWCILAGSSATPSRSAYADHGVH